MAKTIRELHPGGLDYAAGIIGLLDNLDEPFVAQIERNYQHGGGWRPLPGWTFDGQARTIKYPRDEALKPLVEIVTEAGDVALVYAYAWVCVVQPDGAFDVARLD